MTILPRAMTAGELAKVRLDNQSTRLYLTVHVPAIVYSARLAAVPSSNDKVASITYDTGLGTHTNILADMTLYVGTSAGAYDVGMARIRNTTGIGAVTGTFNLGLLSEINWPANAYLTVVDEFALFPRWPYVDDGGTLYMDYDVAYVNQHRYCNSFPIFPRVAVKWLTGATVNVIRDGSQSWALNNVINSYAWAAPGSSAISGETTNTVTITYNAASATAGYRVALTIDNTDSAPFTGYGRVFILQNESDAITQFTVDRLAGSFNSGGWSAQLTLYAEASRAAIRDRAMVVLHRKDFYGLTASDEGSIGYVADDENIEFVGWIDGETINWEPEDLNGSVSFTVQGPQFWLNKLTMPTVGIKNKNGGHPSKWSRFQGLSAKAATWHLLMWRTTAPRMMDCFAIDNGYASLQLQSGGAQTVWEQLSNILDDFLMAKPCCDAYARMFMQIEQQLLSTIARTAIPTVATLTTGDWSSSVPFDRREVNDVAGVDLTGEIYDGVHDMTAVYALAPGRVFNTQGSSIISRKRLAVDSQATLNALAGALLGWKTNPYPRWPFELPSNFHMIDLAPYQYLSVTVATSDTRRELSLTKRLIPREIQRVFTDGYVKTLVTAEAESLIALSVTGDTPAEAPDIPTTRPPDPYIPPTPKPTTTSNAKEAWLATASAIYWSGDYFNGGQPTWNKITTVPGTLTGFNIARDGSSAYALTSSAIYQCTSPKIGATWSAIAYVGLNTGIGSISSHFGYIVGPMITSGNTLVTTAETDLTSPHWVYGEYNGSTWAWADQGNFNMFNPMGVGLDTWADVVPSIYDGSHVLLETGITQPERNEIWHRTGLPRYMPSIDGTGHIILRIVGSASITLGAFSNISQCTTTYVRGAQSGIQVYCVVNGNGADQGKLWLSEDGSAFSNVATWDAGWVEDAQSTGGGSLVWVLRSIASASVPTRLYNRDGSVLRDMTGNFWSLASGDQTVIGMGLVY